MCLLDFKILERWIKNKEKNRNFIQRNNFEEQKEDNNKVLDFNQFYKRHAKTLNLNPFTANLKEEVRNFLREYVEEFDKDTEQILTAIVELP